MLSPALTAVGIVIALAGVAGLAWLAWTYRSTSLWKSCDELCPNSAVPDAVNVANSAWPGMAGANCRHSVATIQRR